MNDPEATDKQEELTAMSISCDAAIIFAERHAELAEKMAGQEADPKRKEELKKIAEICRWVPAHAPVLIGRPYKCTGLSISAPLQS